MSLCDRLEQFFRARPDTWIDGRALAEVAGNYAWRTRASDLRKRGMQIDNRVRIVREHAASCPAVLAWDVPGACQCGRPRTFKISEYRYVAPKGQLALLP